MKRRSQVAALVGTLLGLWVWSYSSQGGSSTAGTPDGSKVEEVLWQLESGQAGQTYVLYEGDLNAFLKSQLEERQRNGIRDLSIRLSEGTITTYLKVNMDELELNGESVSLGFFKALLEGTQRLEVEGKLVAEDGIGTFTAERARLNDIPIPGSLVNRILSAVGRRQEPPFDPTQPFQMPYGIQRVTVEPGKVTIFT